MCVCGFEDQCLVVPGGQVRAMLGCQRHLRKSLVGWIPRRDPASGRGRKRAVLAGVGAVQACLGREKPSTVGGLRVFCLAEVVLVRKPCGPPRGLMIAYGSNGLG